jgi:LytS/YehU family sensor histidine kinase
VALTGGLLLLIAIAVIVLLIAKNKRKNNEIKLAYEKAEIEQKALRAQMNPHFIFNSLNSIQHYILSNETQYAYDYLARFSKLIRQVLINSENPHITLKKELELLEIYMDLEKRRFKNKFDYVIQHQEKLETDEIMIPVMLLQPFVENAIWHGIMNLPEKKQGRLIIDLAAQKDSVKIMIEDNGIGREAAARMKNGHEHKSVGLLFTQKRLDMLQFMNKRNASVNITDLYDAAGNATGTSVNIILPTQF